MTREEAWAAAEDAVYLAACVVKGEKPDAERVAAMDVRRLYEIADLHLLTAIVGCALEEAGVRDPAFIQAGSKAIRKAVLFDAERAAILAELEKAGIWYMPLKGCVLQELYPRLGTRQMADNDILIDAARADDVGAVMKRLGYSAERISRSVHNSYRKPPVLYFEMHWALFGARHKEKLARYYGNVRERLVKDEGNAYGYHLSPEDFYVYMIAHEYKHYAGGGTGLRSLLDTWVYLRKVPLDMAYVSGEVRKLGIADFEAANRTAAFRLFGGEALTEEDRELLEEMLFSGTFGTEEKHAQSLVAEIGRRGYFFSRLTLPYDRMKRLYPVLDKVPLLYPFCWLHRLIRAFLFNRGVFLTQVRAVLARRPAEKEDR